MTLKTLGNDLIIVYKTILRSILDYLWPAYHSLLNKGQSNRIEKLQKSALKIIYGPNGSHDERVKKAGDIEKLEDRRIEITKKFAIKTAAYNRFKHYFLARQQTREGLRPTKTNEVKHAKTEQLYNTPLYYMRRLLNDMTTVTQ